MSGPNHNQANHDQPKHDPSGGVVSGDQLNLDEDRHRPHLWTMTSQDGRECRWECHCGCGARKTTYDGSYE